MTLNLKVKISKKGSVVQLTYFSVYIEENNLDNIMPRNPEFYMYPKSKMVAHYYTNKVTFDLDLVTFNSLQTGTYHLTWVQNVI